MHTGVKVILFLIFCNPDFFFEKEVVLLSQESKFCLKNGLGIEGKAKKGKTYFKNKRQKFPKQYFSYHITARTA